MKLFTNLFLSPFKRIFLLTVEALSRKALKLRLLNLLLNRYYRLNEISRFVSHHKECLLQIESIKFYLLSLHFLALNSATRQPYPSIIIGCFSGSFFSPSFGKESFRTPCSNFAFTSSCLMLSPT